MILICGNLNSGKTTFSNRFENVLHADNYVCKLKPYLDDLVSDIKKYNYNCCVEGLFNTSKIRIELLNKIRNNTITICIFLDTSLEICKRREILNRKGKVDVVEYFHNSFEAPNYSEGWDKIIVIKDNTICKRK